MANIALLCEQKIFKKKTLDVKKVSKLRVNHSIHLHEQKNGEALECFMLIWLSRKNFPEFQMGLRFDVASDQLSAQPHCHSNSGKKTSHNIKQHLYCFDIN
jgi:hypothetical protein